MSCRICYSDEGELLKGACKCTGSIQYICKSCLQKSQDEYGSICGICKTLFQPRLQELLQEFVDYTTEDSENITEITNIVLNSSSMKILFEKITSYAIAKSYLPLLNYLYLELQLPLFYDQTIGIEPNFYNQFIKTAKYGRYEMGFQRNTMWGWKYNPIQPKQGVLLRRESREELEELLIASPRERHQQIHSAHFNGSLEDAINWLCQSDQDSSE